MDECNDPDYTETVTQLWQDALAACTAVIHDAAALGAAQALENLADFLNAGDAVGDGDAEAYERAMARLGAPPSEGWEREALLGRLLAHHDSICTSFVCGVAQDARAALSGQQDTTEAHDE